MFMDPRATLRSSGVGLTGQSIAGLAGNLFSANQQAAAAEQAANQKEGFGRSLIKGVAGGLAGGFGMGLGGNFGSNFSFSNLFGGGSSTPEFLGISDDPGANNPFSTNQIPLGF
jgi:predicted lipid-binding transport protein (Tim44 family)